MVDVFQPLWLQSLYFINKFKKLKLKIFSSFTIFYYTSMYYEVNLNNGTTYRYDFDAKLFCFMHIYGSDIVYITSKSANDIVIIKQV